MPEILQSHQNETPEIWAQTLSTMIFDTPKVFQDDFDQVNKYRKEKEEKELTWDEYFYHRLVIHPSLRETPLAEIFARPDSEKAHIYDQNHSEDETHGTERTERGGFYKKDFDSASTLDDDIKKNPNYIRIYITITDPAGLTSEDIYGTTGLIKELEKENFCGTFKYPIQGRMAESRMESITVYTTDEKNAKIAQNCVQKIFGERCRTWSTPMTRFTEKSFFGAKSERFAKYMVVKTNPEINALVDSLLFR